MKIRFRLSPKTDAENLHEILLTIQSFKVACDANGSKKRVITTMRAKSGIKINEDKFDVNNGIKNLSSRKYTANPDVLYHREQSAKLQSLLAFVQSQLDAIDNDKLTSDWLKNVVNDYYHPEKKQKTLSNKSFYELSREYIKTVGSSSVKNFLSVARAVSRYERFVRETDVNRKDFTFDVHTVTRNDIEDFRRYFRNEKELSMRYPVIFSKLTTDYPTAIGGGKDTINEHGENHTITDMKKLKSFFTWCYKHEITDNRPFDRVEIGAEQYGTPVYITTDEREKIAATAMPSSRLDLYRDIFVFQCFVGCRVSDLVRFTVDNILTDNRGNKYLTYTPHKTHNEGKQPVQARVPLIDDVIAIIEKYEGQSKDGRLFPFPFTDNQVYNYNIRTIFSIAGITRKVEVRNSLTGEIEIRPINEVASSHMARRTFIGNLYSKVQDPNLIGAMSGHVNGSKSFARYRKIEDDTLMSVVQLLK